MGESLEEQAARLLAWGDERCDAGRAFGEVLRALADANMQDADEDESDAAYERKADANTLLFLLATKVTNGHRWVPGTEPLDGG